VVAAQSEAMAAHRVADASRGNRAAGTEQRPDPCGGRLGSAGGAAAEGWGVLAAPRRKAGGGSDAVGGHRLGIKAAEEKIRFSPI
jgi:hypothetical protein